ncbi:MAG: putative Ig domain-containing protein, partial [Verrucomicrobiota bacterium]
MNLKQGQSSDGVLLQWELGASGEELNDFLAFILVYWNGVGSPIVLPKDSRSYYREGVVPDGNFIVRISTVDVFGTESPGAVLVRGRPNGPLGIAVPQVQSIPELSTFSIGLVATNAQGPSAALTFDLVSGPTGLSVEKQGRLAWTPTEAQGPSTNTVVVSVNDGVTGTTNSFTLVVTEVNRAPAFAGATNGTLPEMVGFTRALGANDPDLPTQALAVKLEQGPSGMVMTNGVLAWTPTEAQGPSTNTVVVSVNDGGTGTTNTFTVVVTEVNRPPAFTGATNGTLPEMVGFTRALGANDPDRPTQALALKLEQGPLGMVLTNGVLAWTPTEAQGPSTNTVVVSVNDGVVGTTNSFTLVVTEVNRAPAFAGATNGVLPEMVGFTRALGANDPDVPTQALAVKLEQGPTGMVLTNGVLAWTPTEAQGPSTNTVVVSINDGVTGTTNTFTLVVTEVNRPPTFAGATNGTLPEMVGFTRALGANDPDVPTQALAVKLEQGPSGMLLTNGVLAWTPTEAQGPSTNTVVVSVNDGVVGTTNTFTLVVTEVNRAPAFAGATNGTLPELVGFIRALGANDPDLPTQALAVKLEQGPLGLVVTNGVLAWMATEAQGPSTNTVVVSVNDGVTGTTNTFTLVVTEVNWAPAFAGATNGTLPEMVGFIRALGANDPDLPTQA